MMCERSRSMKKNKWTAEVIAEERRTTKTNPIRPSSELPINYTLKFHKITEYNEPFRSRIQDEMGCSQNFQNDKSEELNTIHTVLVVFFDVNFSVCFTW